MADGPLHDFGALQHKRQDELTSAEAVAYVLHRRQQHVVEYGYRRIRPWCRRTLINRLVQEDFNAFLFAMQDARMDPLIDGQARLSVLGGPMFWNVHIHPLERGDEPR